MDITEDWSIVTYHAIITFIPKIKIITRNTVIDPNKYRKQYFYIQLTTHEIIVDETELRAILAYFNSTFSWLWLKQNTRYIAKGSLGLEVNILRDMPLLNVKRLRRRDVEELARLFDELEANARELATN